MEPHLASNDKLLFYKYLDKATSYMEYGMGGSTYQASQRSNIKNIISVESDKQWCDKLKSEIKNKNNITFIYIDLKSKGNSWGYPGEDSIFSDLLKYSNSICDIDKETSKNIDLVFIDGRFRVACCLKCFDVINDSCNIIFDDFITRKEYHIVLDYYNIIESTEDERMVVLRKKINIESPSVELIKEYETIER